MSPITIHFTQLPHAEGLEPPNYETAGAAGMDLRAALPEGTPIILGSLERSLVPTGLQIELPAHWEAQIRPRSVSACGPNTQFWTMSEAMRTKRKWK